MAFRVSIAPSALADAEDAYFWIKEQSPSHADAWYNGLMEAVFSLETFPARCPVAPESEDIGREIRQLQYGKYGGTYRILFAIVHDEVRGDNAVRIFRIRHGVRDKLQPEELETQ